MDPETGEFYHPLFNWTDDEEILNRLVKPDKLAKVLDEAHFFRQHKKSLIELHSTVSEYCSLQWSDCTFQRYREINADQPLDDIKAKVLSYISQRAISQAGHTARLVIIGQRGSGKATLAAKLAAKYNLVLANVVELVEREKLSGSRLARRIVDYEESGELLPNDLVVQIINGRLEEEDCVKRGWILYGLPLKNGADLLGSFLNGSQTPNRIFFLGLNFLDDTFS